MPSIEILCTPGCHTTQATLPLVEAAVSRVCPGASVQVVDVTAHPHVRSRYAGSPTILVDGEDIEVDVEPAPGAG